MKHIGNLKKAAGSTHAKKRVGRGEGSGRGGTSTRGANGQKSRSGAKIRRGFEGGQMPISRRLPKFGFTNRFRVDYQEVNVGRIQELIDTKNIDTNLTIEDFYTLKLVRKRNVPIKILGNGELTSAIDITADSFSASAKEKIEKVGGKVNING